MVVSELSEGSSLCFGRVDLPQRLVTCPVE